MGGEEGEQAMSESGRSWLLRRGWWGFHSPGKWEVLKKHQPEALLV